MGFSSMLTRRILPRDNSSFRMEIMVNGVSIDPRKVIWFDQVLCDWKGAYQIHEYILDSFELNGEERPNGCEFCVPENTIRELYSRCLRINEDHALAEELLPTYYDERYDEDYFATIEEVIDALEPFIFQEDILYYYCWPR